MWKKFKSIDKDMTSGLPSFAVDVTSRREKAMTPDDIEFLTQFIWYDKRGQYLHMVQFEARKDGKLCALAANSRDIVVSGLLTNKCGELLEYTIREIIDIQYDSETADIWLETPQVGILLRDPVAAYQSFFGAMRYGFKMLAQQQQTDRTIAEMKAGNLVPVPPPRTFEHLPGGTKMGDNFVCRFTPVDITTATCQSGAYVKEMTSMQADREYFSRFVLLCDRGQYLYMTQCQARKKGKLCPILAPSKDVTVLGTLTNYEGEMLTYAIHETTALLYDPISDDLWLETPLGTVLLGDPERGYSTFFMAMKNAHKAALATGGGAFFQIQ